MQLLAAEFSWGGSAHHGHPSELGSPCLNKPLALPGGFGAENRDDTSGKLALTSGQKNCWIQ